MRTLLGHKYVADTLHGPFGLGEPMYPEEGGLYLSLWHLFLFERVSKVQGLGFRGLGL